MTATEFISLMQSRGATIYPAATPRDMELANTGLRIRRYAMLPREIRELYAIAAGVSLDAGYIFPPAEIVRPRNYPIPSIIAINDYMKGVSGPLDGKTIFGRNDLFFFAFDAFGAFYMLDLLSLRPLRKYDDGWRAMSDCLMGGRF